MLTYSLERLSSVLVSPSHLLDPIFKESLSFFHWGGLIVISIGLVLAITSPTESIV